MLKSTKGFERERKTDCTAVIHMYFVTSFVSNPLVGCVPNSLDTEEGGEYSNESTAFIKIPWTYRDVCGIVALIVALRGSIMQTIPRSQGMLPTR